MVNCIVHNLIDRAVVAAGDSALDLKASLLEQGLDGSGILEIAVVIPFEEFQNEVKLLFDLMAERRLRRCVERHLPHSSAFRFCEGCREAELECNSVFAWPKAISARFSIL